MSTRTENILVGFHGIYEVPKAARYLTASLRRDVPSVAVFHNVKSRHLIGWIRAGLTLHALAEIPGRSLLITFEDLISMRVVAVLRAMGVSWPKIHRAEEWLRQATGYQRPFAIKRVWTETADVFAEFPLGFIAASRHGQIAFAELLGQYLEPIGDLEFEPYNGVHVAATWNPHDDVLLRPQVQFGEPCIKGTRIPTDSLWRMWKGGDSLGYLARSFEISSTQVEHALEWENRLRAAPAQSPALSG